MIRPLAILRLARAAARAALDELERASDRALCRRIGHEPSWGPRRGDRRPRPPRLSAMRRAARPMTTHPARGPPRAPPPERKRPRREARPIPVQCDEPPRNIGPQSDTIGGPFRRSRALTPGPSSVHPRRRRKRPGGRVSLRSCNRWTPPPRHEASASPPPPASASPGPRDRETSGARRRALRRSAGLGALHRPQGRLPALRSAGRRAVLDPPRPSAIASPRARQPREHRSSSALGTRHRPDDRPPIPPGGTNPSPPPAPSGHGPSRHAPKRDRPRRPALGRMEGG